MKKFFSLILTALIMCTLIGCGSTVENSDSKPESNSETNIFEEYNYVIVKDEYVILNIYFGNEKNPEIPEKINGKPVKIIGSSCFAAKEIESITIPDTITEIWEMAFLNCRKLSSVTLSKNLTKISNKAFESCRSLQSIELPETLEAINVYAFFDCSSLKKITVPKNVTTVGTYAFASSGLTELKFLGDAPTEWGEYIVNTNADTVIYHPADAHGWDDEKFDSYTLKAY